MEASRELDALVAEKVMGWKLFEGEPGYGRPPEKWSRPSLVLDPIPAYSTDIAAAWMVVEKIHNCITNEARDGKRNDLNYLTLSVVSRYGETAASFDLDELPYDWFEDMSPYPFAARGKTPAHAICLAALKTVGVSF